MDPYDERPEEDAFLEDDLEDDGLADDELAELDLLDADPDDLGGTLDDELADDSDEDDL